MGIVEEWKFISWVDGIPADKYQVSNLGRIKNTYTGNILKTYAANKRSNRLSCQLSTAPNKPFKQKIISVGRCVALAFVPVPKNCEVDSLRIFYKDGDPSNCEYTNLQWVMEYHANGEVYTVEQRRKLLNLIKENASFTSAKIAAICSEKLNRNITPGMIRQLTFADNKGNPKSRQYEMLNMNASEFMRERTTRKLTADEVRVICKFLVKNGGDVSKTMQDLNDANIEVKQAVVKNIKWKEHYTHISDEYFDYDDGEFTPVRSFSKINKW